MKDLIQYISENKNTNPNKVFIKTSEGDISYKDAFIRMNNLSHNLYQPKHKQRHIGLLLDDSPEFIISFLAILRNNDVAVLYSPQMDKDILVQKLNSLNLTTIIYHEEYRAVIKDSKINCKKIVIGDCEDNELDFNSLLQYSESLNYRIPFLNIEFPAVVAFTSGTNGTPKNVLLSHKGIISNIISCQSILQNEKNLNFLGFPELTNFISLTLILGMAICTTGSITLSPMQSPNDVLDSISKNSVDIFVTVPKNLQQLINHPKSQNINRLKYTLSLSSPLDEEFVDIWENKFKSTLLQGYGLTESLIVSFNKINNIEKPGSIGRPLNDVKMKILNSMKIELPTGRIGELHIKSPANMISYLNSDKNKIYKDRWLPTGDLVKKDHEGYYHYVDKKINIIHKSGFSIFPEDIETVLKKHPLISKIHVMKMLGERDDNIKFCIVPKDNSKLQQNEIKEYARKHLPHFLQPEFIEMYSEFPENYLGKIFRNKFIHSH